MQTISTRKALTLCGVCALGLSPKAKATRAKVWVGKAIPSAVRRTRIAREKGTHLRYRWISRTCDTWDVRKVRKRDT